MFASTEAVVGLGGVLETVSSQSHGSGVACCCCGCWDQPISDPDLSFRTFKSPGSKGGCCSANLGVISRWVAELGWARLGATTAAMEGSGKLGFVRAYQEQTLVSFLAAFPEWVVPGPK